MHLTEQAERLSIAGRDRPAQVEIVEVTPEMIAAGLERAREVAGEPPEYVVSAIYLAMEYERLGSLGQLSRLGDQALKVR
jgi:hypothetical protein